VKYDVIEGSTPVEPQPALFTKAISVIEKVVDFIIEAGLFDLFKFGATCFLFTTNTRLPSQLARYQSTPGIKPRVSRYHTTYLGSLILEANRS